MVSPYTPGSGKQPRVLVGRSELLARIRADLTRVQLTGSSSPYVTVFTGPRGLGKTVLLGQARRIAGELGFVTAHVGLDRSSTSVQRVAHAIGEALLGLLPIKRQLKRLGDLLGHFSLEISAAGMITSAAQWTPGPDSAQAARDHLRTLLSDAAAIAHDRAGGSGLVLTLDELQDSPADQLAILAHAIQDATGDDVPVAVVAAGLPTTPETVMGAASFTERFRYQHIERLDSDAALIALTQPAMELGVTWSAEAADHVVEQAAGAPYLLQLFGDETWMAASPTGPSLIETVHAARGVTAGLQMLDNGLFRGRWKMATGLERDLLVAIADLLDNDGTAPIGRAAERIGRSVKDISVPRQRLIDKGIIEAVGYGKVAFTMPGFEMYVAAQALTDRD